MSADNVISGPSSGYVEVTIPAGATFLAQTGPNPNFQFSGAGRLVGAWLVETGKDLLSDADEAQELLVARYGFCPQPGCEPTDTTQVLISSGTDGTSTLRPGNYRLYLFTDGAPASVRLQFQGLEGSTKMSPTTTVQTSLTEPEVILSSPANLVYSNAGIYEFPGKYGFSFDVVSAVGDRYVTGRQGHCIRPQYALVVPMTVAHAVPGCPGGLETGVFNVGGEIQLDGYRVDYYGALLFSGSATWGLGSYYQAPALTDDIRALRMTMNIDSI